MINLGNITASSEYDRFSKNFFKAKPNRIKSMKIYMIRHGETTSDVENRYGGDYDDHLTAKGVEQAKQLAAKFANHEIQIIFSSSRIRTKETSEILKDTLDCDVQIVDDLRERNTYGVLTGMVKTDARNKYPELVSLVRDYRNTIDGAESYNNFLSRVKNAFDQIVKTPYDSIAVISHGGPIKCIFRDVLKMGELNDLADCAIIELEKNDLNFKVTKMDGASFA
jgi:broad specificity phosphatase PhoE